MSKILKSNFYRRPVLQVAPELLGKYLVRQIGNQQIAAMITEVEAYVGVEDLACHASKGRTSRTEVMFCAGGVWYPYLIYGMYWLLNIVTGKQDHPTAIFISGVE